jgi:RND family efflux transporter MFP subunit
VSGEVIAGEVDFLPAQTFSKGALFLKIDDRQANLRLNSIKSDLLSALAMALPEIKTDYPEAWDEWQEFFSGCDFDRNVPPLPETASERLKLLLARLNIYKLYFSVRDQEIVLEKHRFYAPFDGSIVQVNSRTGSTVRTGSLLGSIINLENQEVQVSLPASDLTWIDTNAIVSLTSSETLEQWQGRVVRIGSNIDTRTQTVDLFVALVDNNSSPLLNGAFLQALIPGRIVNNGVTIPGSSVYQEKYVYLVIDGKLKSSEITIARWEGNSAIIAKGLENGDTVVVEAMQGVIEGMPTTPKFNGVGGSR